MKRPRFLFVVLLTVCASSLALHSAQTGVTGRDEDGASPLMYAAAFGSLEDVRSLLDGGADVNAPAKNGATALMWATGDPAKVRLLLDRGAAINARAEDGTTALISASHRGNPESMRLLIDRGADVKQAADGLLAAAFGATNPEVSRVLRGAGVVAANLGQVAPALQRIDLLDAPLVRELLDVGMDPNMKLPFVTVQFPLLGYAAFTGDLDLTRALVERGADPNLATTPRNSTPLMMAAASDRPNPALVRLLLDRGARTDARDEAGRSALDWALMQGNTEMARVLRDAGVPSGAPLPPAPAGVARPRPARAAMATALARMDRIGPAFYGRTKCISCHNQSLPAIARQLAATRGVAVAPASAAHPTQATLEVWRPQRSAFMLGRCGGGGFVQSVTYGLTSMAAEGVPRTPLIDAAVTCLAIRQYPDGSWPAIDVRPPLGGTPVVFTALAIRSLDAYAPPGLRVEMDARIVRARDFLSAADTPDTQDVALKLLGLVWAKASPEEIAQLAKTLLALQRQDGGWGQVPTMAPDAYATGQALYALAASGTRATDAAYQRGVAYLLRTQLEDGTWFVRTRGFGFQPYFDYGFPHGTSQFISAAATSWAVMALAQN